MAFSSCFSGVFCGAFVTFYWVFGVLSSRFSGLFVVFFVAFRSFFSGAFVEWKRSLQEAESGPFAAKSKSWKRPFCGSPPSSMGLLQTPWKGRQEWGFCSEELVLEEVVSGTERVFSAPSTLSGLEGSAKSGSFAVKSWCQDLL